MDVEKSMLLHDLDTNTALFLDILDTIPDRKLHAKNEKTQWSIMEVAEHMLIMEQEVATTLEGEARPTEGRTPDSKLPQLENVFLDLQTRTQYRRPENSAVTYADVRNFATDFRANRERIKQAVANRDISQELTGYEHPHFGFLTGLEWLHYLVVHTERHLHQINRIESVLTEPPA